MTSTKHKFSLPDLLSVHIPIFFRNSFYFLFKHNINICSVLSTVYFCPMGQSKNKLGKREELLYCKLAVVDDDLIAGLTSTLCL